MSCPQCEIRAQLAAFTPERIRALADAEAYQEGITAAPALYEKRLRTCAACPHLKSGVLCADCGSYVAFRAKLKAATCPFPGTDKWETAV